MKGKCNCGKKATAEYLVTQKKCAYTIKFCNTCKPTHPIKQMQLIYGK